MERVVLGMAFCCVMSAMGAVPRSVNQDESHALCQQVTNGLISIRKDFPGSQSRVCTLLDQVDKMYSITKTLHQKKRQLEMSATGVDSSIKKLRDENRVLRAEVLAAKQKFELTFKELESMHKQLELTKRQAVQNSKAESEKQTKVIDEKFKEKLSKTVEEEVAAQIAQIKKLAEAQSLSLTSTSAPISPR